MTQRTVVLSGASGVVGSALKKLLQERGDRVVQLVRREPRFEEEARWDPDAGTIDAAAVAGADAFIHLSGENVGDKRWSAEQKRVIVESRTKTTGLLARTAAEAARRPAAFVSASAVGYYGFDSYQPTDESAPRGEGFLAEVCAAWEQAAEPAHRAGIRAVQVRLGVVLTMAGGALAKLVPIFKAGVGGPVGSGKQMMSWLSLADAARGFAFAMDHEALQGPVNLCAPNPVDNRSLAKTLGHVLHRPAIVPAPAFAIKAMFGQMGVETVLASQCAVPKKLLEAGFVFAHPELEGALRAELPG